MDDLHDHRYAQSGARQQRNHREGDERRHGGQHVEHGHQAKDGVVQPYGDHHVHLVLVCGEAVQQPTHGGAVEEPHGAADDLERERGPTPVTIPAPSRFLYVTGA